MALKIFNPTRTGKGVDKNQPEKKRFFLFFELFFRKFWNICLVNLMFFVTLLPFVILYFISVYNGFNFGDGIQGIDLIWIGILLVSLIPVGPGLCAMCQVLNNYALQRPVFLKDDFLETYKNSFRQGILMFYMYLAIFVALIAAFSYYLQQSNQGNGFMTVMMVFCLFFMFLFYMSFCYMLTMVPILEQKYWPMFKNSIIFALAGLKTNIFTFLFTVGFSVLLLLAFFTVDLRIVFLIFLFFTAVIYPALMCFIILFNSYKLVDKYVIAPYYEQTEQERPDEFHPRNPEVLEPVFEDMGSREVTVETKAPKQKGKTRTIK